MKTRIASRAHPVQGILCAHGYRNATERTLPVEAIFVAIRAYEVRATCEIVDSARAKLELYSNGKTLEGAAKERMAEFIGRLNTSYWPCHLKIDLRQNFASQIGIGSSAAVFASVGCALCSIESQPIQERRLSAVARLGSYSAAAAVTGNVSVIRVREEAEENLGEVLCPSHEFPFRLLVVPIHGSKHSEDIHADIVRSRYYATWKAAAQATSTEMVRSIQARDWESVGQLAENYIFENLSAICTGPRRLMPWVPDTFRVLQHLRDFRATEGLNFFISTNSGPAVFVYANPGEAPTICRELKRLGMDPVESDVGGKACLLESSDVLG